MMNIISFDIEEWFVEQQYFGDRADQYSFFSKYLDSLLAKLDENKLKATFFCVGGMAREFPHIVKEIEKRGHDIGCHSNRHIWMNKMSEAEAREDTYKAINSIEQLIGKKVICYRAPAFTIGESNKWMFDILVENGIEVDASVYPAVRDFGGFPAFSEHTPAIIRYNGVELKEFPVSTTKVLGKEIAYSGGGFFRLLPLWYVMKTMAKKEYNMTYFHIGDLIPVKSDVSDEVFEHYYKIPSTKKNRLIRGFKSNVGKKRAFSKLLNLIDAIDFVSLNQAVSLIDWNEAPIVEL